MLRWPIYPKDEKGVLTAQRRRRQHSSLDLTIGQQFPRFLKKRKTWKCTSTSWKANSTLHNDLVENNEPRSTRRKNKWLIFKRVLYKALFFLFFELFPYREVIAHSARKFGRGITFICAQIIPRSIADNKKRSKESNAQLSAKGEANSS